MPDVLTEFAPVSDATTEGIRVEVIARYLQEQSRPSEEQWVFQYTVRITNNSAEVVQLMSRHWIITEAHGTTREVRGPGVIGQQPTLALGESFQYSSYCPLHTAGGSMRGSYSIVGEGGREFDIAIAEFGLRGPRPIR